MRSTGTVDGVSPQPSKRSAREQAVAERQRAAAAAAQQRRNRACILWGGLAAIVVIAIVVAVVARAAAATRERHQVRDRAGEGQRHAAAAVRRERVARPRGRRDRSPRSPASRCSTASPVTIDARPAGSRRRSSSSPTGARTARPRCRGSSRWRRQGVFDGVDGHARWPPAPTRATRTTRRRRG